MSEIEIATAQRDARAWMAANGVSSGKRLALGTGLGNCPWELSLGCALMDGAGLHERTTRKVLVRRRAQGNRAQGVDAALIAFRGRLLAMREGGGSIFRTATVRKYTRG